MIRGNVHSGKCPFGEILFRELHVGELSVPGTLLWEQHVGEMTVEEMSVGELSGYRSIMGSDV